MGRRKRSLAPRRGGKMQRKDQPQTGNCISLLEVCWHNSPNAGMPRIHNADYNGSN